jgi:predicted ATP-grasp superfamily ATP-dependent carboligase
VSRDIAAAIQLMLMDRLNVGDWFKGYRQKLTFAVFALDDPLPAFLELPTTLTRVLLRMFARNVQAIRPQSKPPQRDIKTRLL